MDSARGGSADDPAGRRTAKTGCPRQRAAHEATLRNAVLVESVQGLEDIKLMQAENRFLQQWNSYIRITGESGLRTRKLTQRLISWGCRYKVWCMPQ